MQLPNAIKGCWLIQLSLIWVSRYGFASASSGGYAASVLRFGIFFDGYGGVCGIASFAEQEAATIDRLGLGEKQPTISVFILILMFSMAGIPPFAGFWAGLSKRVYGYLASSVRCFLFSNRSFLLSENY